MASNSILKDDIPIDRIRWALPRRYFFCGEAGALRGGERPQRGGGDRLALDPSTTSLRLSAQNDTRGFHVYDDRAIESRGSTSDVF